MDVEAVVLLLRERQFGKEAPLGLSELASGPLDCDLGFDVEVFARVADRIVVVTTHGKRALVDEVHDGRHRPLGVGAIADIVAEQDVLLRAVQTRRGEAGFERLPIGVDVREQGDQHGGPLRPRMASLAQPALIPVNEASKRPPRSLRGKRRLRRWVRRLGAIHQPAEQQHIGEHDER
jgi:hypothetical protein